MGECVLEDQLRRRELTVTVPDRQAAGIGKVPRHQQVGFLIVDVAALGLEEERDRNGQQAEDTEQNDLVPMGT